MKTDINKDKIIQSIRDFYRNDNALQYYLDRNKANILLDYITNLQQENKQLKEQLENDIDRYEDTISYQLGYDKGKEYLQQKIDKAIEYIKSIKMVNCKLFDYNRFLKEHLISIEELRKKVEEDGTLEGHFVEVNKDKLLEILGDKE